ncbi:MAG: hypothetical protein JSW61_04025 [Candidatus Thorarchaeota archaeon]|nr:MAG: hypothetical protein JSW61_04025 [Candidatus Thorarchaeota archaeon]
MLCEESSAILELVLSGHHIDYPGFVSQGLASDSMIITLTICGIAAMMALVLGLVMEGNSDSPERGLARRKPLLIPSIVFTATAILVVSLAPIPMAQFRGYNETRFALNEDQTISFSLYDSEAYSRTLNFMATTYLETDESIVVYLRIYQNDSLVLSAALPLLSPLIDEMVVDDTDISIQPGVFTANLSYAYTGSLPSSTSDRWIQVTLSQPLAPGFLSEIIIWDGYRFILGVGSFFFILGGICVGKEERKRRSLKRVDQEPPREGEIYVRKWG